MQFKKHLCIESVNRKLFCGLNFFKKRISSLTTSQNKWKIIMLRRMDTLA